MSKLYAELPQVELPDHLDAAILAEAHRAVNSRPGARPKRRWTIPLGLVASLIVAVMVGLQLPYMLKDAAQPQQLKEERMAALMDKNTTEPASPAPVEARESQLMEKVKSGITLGKPAPREAEGATAGNTPARANAPVRAAPSESTSAESSRLGATSVIVPSPVAAPSPLPAPAPVTASKRLELRVRGDIDSGAILSKEKKAFGHAEGYVSDSLEQRAPAAARTAVPQPVQADRPLRQPIKEEASEASLRPEDWLIRIKRLKREGKPDEAKKDLAAFKKRYPDYPVPAEFEIR